MFRYRLYLWFFAFSPHPIDCQWLHMAVFFSHFHFNCTNCQTKRDVVTFRVYLFVRRRDRNTEKQMSYVFVVSATQKISWCLRCHNDWKMSPAIVIHIVWSNAMTDFKNNWISECVLLASDGNKFQVSRHRVFWYIFFILEFYSNWNKFSTFRYFYFLLFRNRKIMSTANEIISNKCDHKTERIARKLKFDLPLFRRPNKRRINFRNIYYLFRMVSIKFM